jgi:DNA (cytosine-5)-methyltransferase 1
MKILNLYAGIGGNRKLWGDEHEVTAVENVDYIAEAYRKLYPNDTVIEADAHQYLLEHFKEYDFIWSSPPCPTHSRLNTTFDARGILKYPDMRLYQEIILLKHFCYVPWVVENVIGYYRPLIAPTRELARHYFWTNFYLSKYYREEGGYNLVMSNIGTLQDYLGIDLPPNTKEARKLLRNCVHPKLGQHVFENRYGLIQEALL